MIGERWSLPVVRELVFGPRRYSDLATALPGVSTNILGDRLRNLADTGVIRKRRLNPPAATTVYELTAWGSALEPVLIALGNWAAHTPVDLDRQAFSPASFALSLKTTFDAGSARDVDLHLQFITDNDEFDARIENGTFSIERMHQLAEKSGFPDEGLTRVHADPKSLAAIVYAGLDPAEAMRSDLLRIEGSPDMVAAFAQCFVLPRPPMEGSL